MDINIKGYIVNDDEAWIYDWLGISCTSPSKVIDLIEKAKTMNEKLTVKVNSPGGSVYAGSEIYTELKKYGCYVEIVAFCASAASFIAMAGDKISISPTAEVMIHRASCGIKGNRNDMLQAADMLDDIDAAIANAYRLKTGLPEDEILDMMNHETYLNAQKCKKLGFADEIMFDTGNVLNTFDHKLLTSVTNSFENGIPSELILAIKEKMNKEEGHSTENEKDFLIAKAKMKLNLLNLGGK